MAGDELPAGFTLDDPNAAALPDGFTVDKREDSAISGMLRRLDDLARSFASGATFGLADELAAGTYSLVGGKSYADLLAEERARDAEIPGYIKIPGEIAGGLATGMGASRAGLTLLNTAKPTVANMALRGAGEGAIYGGLHGFGKGEGEEERLRGLEKGAIMGAVTGGATGAVAGKMAQNAAEKAVPATAELRAQADAAYKAAENAGVVLQPASFGGLIDDIGAEVAKKGFTPALHPKAAAALAELEKAKGQSPSLEAVDRLRQVLGDAAGSLDRGERRIAKIAIQKLDDFVEKLSAKDIVAGDADAAVPALSQARDLWSRFRKGEVIDRAVEKARNQASQFSGSGFENALRTQFRQLLNNEKAMRGFTAEEREAIQRVVRGGPVENVLRGLGRFAPTGPVSAAAGAALGSALTGGSVAATAAGGGAAMAIPAIGAASRTAAEAMTRGNVDAASAVVRSGGKMPPATLTPAQRAMFEALLIGEAQEGPATVDAAPGMLRYLLSR